MSSSGIATIDSTINATNVWLKELADRLEWGHDSQRAYHALRAVLHTLRDRLGVQEAADLGAQLPILLRGFYCEGWHPAGKPLREQKQEQFLSHIEAAFP